MVDPTKALLDEMAKFDLHPGTIIWDGEVKRFPGPGKKKSNDDGWYIAFVDRFGALFGDHPREIDEHWKAYNGKRPDEFDAETWARMQREQEDARKKALEDRAARDREREANQEKVAIACRERWQRAGPASLEHPYLARKGVTSAEGLAQEGDLLLVPMKIDKQIWSLQRIWPDGKKRFVPGGRVKGACTTIGAAAFKDDNTLYIVEGWVTGWAVHHVTGSAVVVAFDANKLKAAAALHREQYPEAKIIVCADNDRHKPDHPNTGLVAATEAAKAAKAKLVVPDFVSLDGKPTDFNDLLQREGREAVLKWLDPKMAKKARTRLEGPEPELPEQAAPEPPPAPADVSWYKDAPFRCLGYDHGTYYYLGRENGQIYSLAPYQHGEKSLIPLAWLSWWEATFPASKGANWSLAADALIRASHRAGVFRPERLRGRGCWPDRKGVILHLGDELLPPEGTERVDPESYVCSANMIYERQPHLEGPGQARPLDSLRARAVLALFQDLLWQDPTSGALLAGFTVLAPVCGALPWRPHVWVVGAKGSGKTTVLQRLVIPLLGGMACYCEGGTTEAGIRQRLRADALPVVYDEAERTDGRTEARIQSVIGLARSASSTGAETLKGTTHGSALSFQIRSMFCLASIGGAIRQEADKSRISLLQLRADIAYGERAAHWSEYNPRLMAVTEDLGRGLIARTLQWLRSGRLAKTLTVFRSAASAVLGDARAGDQYGTLYAGAWTLMADDVPDPLEAREYLAESDLGVYLSDQDPEGVRAMQAILQQHERIDTKDGPKTFAVGELVDAAADRAGASCPSEDAKKALRRFGLRVELKHGAWVLLVANQSAWIDQALRDTPYVGNVAMALRTLPGVEPGGMVYFHQGMKPTRTTMVPLAALG
jgi:putative DNA primase/helicase